MVAGLFWMAFLVVFALSRLRLFQTEGQRDRIVYILYAIGAALVLGTGLYSGWTAGGIMLAGWFVLPFIAQPVVTHFAGSPTSPVGQTVAAAEQAQRMGRVNRGEISLGDYFKEGRDNDDAARQRLEALATRRDIGAVLAKYKITPAKFFVLREKLIKIREIEWDVLGNPSDLERLIVMSAGYKSETEIGNTFRGRKRGG
jgi:hypothetical protein